MDYNANTAPSLPNHDESVLISNMPARAVIPLALHANAFNDAADAAVVTSTSTSNMHHSPNATSRPDVAFTGGSATTVIASEENVTSNFPISSNRTLTECNANINNSINSNSRPQRQHAAAESPSTTPVPSALLVTIPPSSSIMCRICHTSDRPDRLISPCLCKGTLGYVHRHCLEYWLSRARILHCELCLHDYKTQTTLRYHCCESLRIWFRHPNNRGLLQSDLMVFSLLTIVTFGLVSMSLVGLQYFMLQGNRAGFSRSWTRGSLIIFLVIIIVAYVVNTFLLIRAQVGPWYKWWRSVRSVRVILPKRLEVRRTTEKEIDDIVLSSTV